MLIYEPLFSSAARTDGLIRMAVQCKMSLKLDPKNANPVISACQRIRRLEFKLEMQDEAEKT
jgi:hypothetical protein